MAQAVQDTNNQADARNLTGTQKSAILMMMLGEDHAASVLASLNPREVQHLGAAMYSVRGVDQKTVNAVLDDFIKNFWHQSGLGGKSETYIQNALIKALGSEKALSVLSRITPASRKRPIEILDWVSPPAIAEMIVDEHPQIIALVISNLERELAASTLALMPEGLHADIITRIAKLTTVQPNALKDLERVMQSKFKANTSARSSQFGGVKTAAEIMNFTPQAMGQRISSNIRKVDKEIMEAIQDNMFVFDNLADTDNRSLQTLLRGVETDLLVLALKGANQHLREALLSGVSSRAAQDIYDELEVLGPVRLSDVQEAQTKIISIARRMSEDGDIVLAGSGGEQMV